MRLRWLLIATFTMLLTPSLASARRPIYEYRGVTIQEMEAEAKGDPSGTLVAEAPPAPPPLHRCGLTYQPAPLPPAPSKPSKLPYVFAIAGLLVALALRKRAGTDEAHMPDCLP